ncbi:MAG: acetyl-CoA carboxylase biotin carboxyl carrier protein subunit, partial [Acidimicrobiales bacterium]
MGDDGTGGTIVPAPGSKVGIDAPLQGTVVLLPLAPGDRVVSGGVVAVLESMKMEHVVRSPVSGTLDLLGVEVGALVVEGQQVAVVEAGSRVPISPKRPKRSSSTTSAPTWRSCLPVGGCWPTPGGPMSS